MDMKKLFYISCIALLIIGLGTAAVKTLLLYTSVEELKTYASVDKIKNLFNKKTVVTQAPPTPVQVAIPDLPTLAMQQSGIQAPTPKQIQERQQIIKRQLTSVKSWLSSASPRHRYIGAEQLSAYPTPESESMLIKALSDKESAVRSVAAKSLGAFEKLSHPAINALLTAVEDKSQSVQFNAIFALENQIAKEPRNTERYQFMLKGLQNKAMSAMLSDEMAETVNGFIEERNNLPS
jgi:hypothetical protein